MIGKVFKFFANVNVKEKLRKPQILPFFIGRYKY